METSPHAASSHEAWTEQFHAMLRAQRQRAAELLAAQQARLDQAESLIKQQLEQVHDNRLDGDADLQHRYDLALEELRHLETTNSDLQQQLAKARSTTTKLAQQARQPGCLDWEAEKQRILAALESDPHGDDEGRQADRLKIVEVLRTTDEAVAAKNREIQEMKQRLEDQSRSDAAKTSERAAMDHDPVIQEERERLKRLQKECQEKLRSAEIELALERANIARQRAELEDLRKAENTATGSPQAAVEPGQTKPSAHGRWLAQLGLTAADREPRRQR